MLRSALIAMLAFVFGACNGPKEGASKPPARAPQLRQQQGQLSASDRPSLSSREGAEGVRDRKRRPITFIQEVPAADDCIASAHIVTTPKTPVRGQPLRVIAVLPTGSATLQLWDEHGEPLQIKKERELGGPPFGRVVDIETTVGSMITAVVGQDGNVVHCKQIALAARAPAAPQSSQFVWEAERGWKPVDDALWSLFVEALFDYPPDDTQTWTNLHDLVSDKDRNILYNHLGVGEEEHLTLEPDCADLPYQLRAYFAWKRALPFAFRWCTRGQVAKPPTCGALKSNHTSRERSSDAEAFEYFAQRVVRPGVHSASGRTHPQDEQTDLYPVPLQRRALSPGTVYADPYGHVMILTEWIEQADGDSGILMAAEAQPDGTVGRRRFWRGSFLFDPDTTHVGAGFKHFRPLDLQRGKAFALDNATLKSTDAFSRLSNEQYDLTRDEFYERMDALINPRPLNPRKKLLALIDAFDESVQRRVTAVQNGENYVQAHGTIAMPEGHAIFETSGPWEDYSSPSRDMRLLISLDTVTNFVSRVSHAPARFGVKEASKEQVVRGLKHFLREELGRRQIRYAKSNGSEQALSLWQVLKRAKAFEVAYNPNDCIELRWGAPEGSEELGSCARRAPKEQQSRMARYRKWFAERTRPARGTD